MERIEGTVERGEGIMERIEGTVERGEGIMERIEEKAPANITGTLS